MYNWGNSSKERMRGVNSLLIECATRALRKSSYDMTIPWMGGLRTAEEQNEIFKAGNSKCDGYDKKSYHQTGMALDVIPVGVDPYANTEVLNHFAKKMFEAWQEMIYQGAAKGLLYWGGHWGASGWDKPHWEIRGL
jgi:peptidoglycan L-alanyl-D-glutamate endopeptidase CwlK